MRLVRWLAVSYLIVAATTRVMEIVGLHRCGCAQDCWCRRQGLNAFRWVFPYAHRSIDPAEKERLATG